MKKLIFTPALLALGLLSVQPVPVALAAPIDLPTTIRIETNNIKTFRSADGKEILLYEGWVNSAPGSTTTYRSNLGIGMVTLPQISTTTVLVPNQDYEVGPNPNCTALKSAGALSAFTNGSLDVPLPIGNGESLNVVICSESVGGGSQQYLVAFASGGNPNAYTGLRRYNKQ